MGFIHLKRIRIGISVLFFVLVTGLFVDIRNSVAPAVSGKVLYLQFVPSLLRFLQAAACGATGFVVVGILTVLFGRVYCATICPLGTLQDGIGFVARKYRRRTGFRFAAPHNALRYAILAVTVLLMMTGSGWLLNLLDPFSNFGRIAANLLRPAVLAVNNLGAKALEQVGVHALYQVRWTATATVATGYAVMTLLLVGWLSAGHGRLYCNTLCPVGALLGLVAKGAMLRIRIDPAACKGCTRCESVCKAACIDVLHQTVDATRCVGCCNCLAACRRGGLGFENTWRRRRRPSSPEAGRRGFLLNACGWLVGITGLVDPTRTILQSRPTTIPIRLTHPVAPPGAVSIAHFTSACTACHLCVSACPPRVLVPSFLEFGFLGMMQPRLRYDEGHCSFDCTICTGVCPSGALSPLTVERKKLTQIGVARFIKDNCVVHTDRTNCGACSEHCPTKAVAMVPYPIPSNQKLVIPEVNPDYCIGCGGCEHACPTKPYKAIYVDGSPVHKLARKPVVKALDRQVDGKEDFPF